MLNSFLPDDVVSRAPFDPPRSTPDAGTHRVLIVDDHPIIVRGLKALLDRAPALTVCATASTISEARRLLHEHRPHLAIVDVTLGAENGVDLTREISERHPATKVIVLSMHAEELYGERALSAGARGYVVKHSASESILAAVDTVLDGGLFVGDALKKKMLARAMVRKSRWDGSLEGLLTPREIEVFRLIGEGLGITAIAKQLGISVKTVDTYREHLKTKLEMEAGHALSQYAVQWLRTESAKPWPASS